MNVEKPKATPSQSPDNYFERVNTEYEKALASGEVLKNKEILKDIAEKNKEGFFSKVMDALKNPKEAYKWLKYVTISSLAGTWLGEKLGLKKIHEKMRAEILKITDNPVARARKAMLDMGGFTKLKQMGYDGGSVFGQAKFPEKYLEAGELGVVAGKLFEVEKYLQKNKEEAKSMPEDKTEQRKWWGELLDKLNIKGGERDKVLKILNKEVSVKEAFVNEQYEGRVEEVEMVPFAEAREAYQEGIMQAVHPIRQWVVEHKTELTATFFLGLGLSENVRSAVLSVGTTGALTAKKMASLAMFFGKVSMRHPIISSLGFGAAILAVREADFKNIKVPKNPEHLKNFFDNKLLSASDVYQTYDLPDIPDEHWGTISGVLSGNAEKLRELYDSMMDFAEQGVSAVAEVASLTPEKMVLSRNKVGIRSLMMELEGMRIEDADMIEETDEVIANLGIVEDKLENGDNLNNVQIATIKSMIEPLGMRVEEEGGYIMYSVRDNDGVWQKRTLCIDPGVNMSKQAELAKGFAVDRTDWASAVGKLASVPFDDVRMLLNDVLFQDVESKAEAGEVLKRELNSGGMIAIEGGMAFLMQAGYGFAKKTVIGPAELVWNLSSAIPGGEEFSAVDLAVDYAEGILPVTIFGFASTLAKGDFKNLGFKKILWQGLTYPVTGTKKIAGFIYKNPIEVIKNSKKGMSSSLQQSMENWKANAKVVFGGNRKLNRKLAHLHEARKLATRAKSNPFLESEYYSEARRALKDAGFDHIDPEDLDGMGKIEDAISSVKKTKVDLKNQNRLVKDLKKQARTNPEAKKRLELEEKRLGEIQEGKRVADVEAPRSKGKSVDAPEGKVKQSRVAENLDLPREVREIDESILKKGETLKDLRKRLAKKHFPDGITNSTKTQRQAFQKALESQKRIISDDIMSLYKKRVKLNIDAPKIKGGKFNKVKTIGKGVGGVLLTIGVMYGASELINWATGEASRKDLSEVYRKRQEKMMPKKKNIPSEKTALPPLSANDFSITSNDRGQDYVDYSSDEFSGDLGTAMLPNEDLSGRYGGITAEALPINAEEAHEEMEFLLTYFEMANSDYDDVFAEFSPQNIRDWGEAELVRKMDEAERKHGNIIREMEEMIGKHSAVILDFYRNNPSYQDVHKLGQIATLSYLKGEDKLSFKYASASSFRSKLGEQVHFIEENLDDLLAGKELSTAGQVAGQLAYAAPVYGTYLDASDAYRNFSRGNIGDGLSSSAWAVFGGVSDVLMLAGGSGLILKAIRGGKVAGSVAKGVRGVSVASRLSANVGKITLAMTGADLLRPLMKPDKNSETKF